MADFFFSPFYSFLSVGAWWSLYENYFGIAGTFPGYFDWY